MSEGLMAALWRRWEIGAGGVAAGKPCPGGRSTPGPSSKKSSLTAHPRRGARPVRLLLAAGPRTPGDAHACPPALQAPKNALGSIP